MILSLCSVCAKQILFVQCSKENIFCVQNQIIARKFARKRVRNGFEGTLQFLAWARRRCCSIQRISPEEGFSVKNQTNLCLVWKEPLKNQQHVWSVLQFLWTYLRCLYSITTWSFHFIGTPSRNDRTSLPTLLTFWTQKERIFALLASIVTTRLDRLAFFTIRS